MRHPKSLGHANIFSDPTRHLCPDCRQKLTPCVKVHENGSLGKVVLACFCTNRSCYRSVDLSKSISWVRAESSIAIVTLDRTAV